MSIPRRNIAGYARRLFFGRGVCPIGEIANRVAKRRETFVFRVSVV